VRAGVPAPGERPSLELFADVVGQTEVVTQLRAWARRPVHAYLLVGRPGLCQQQLVRGFAASLLCHFGGCGECDVCRRALSGVHPDLVEVERTGASITVDDARRVVRLAQRRPVEGHRQVIVVSDVHLARLAAPVLLKTLEDPAEQTVFVLLAESVPAELATIASRCIRIDLRPLGVTELAAWLESQGLEADRAKELAQAASGSAERARLLSEDSGFAQRRALWRSVPASLDGTGASAAVLASELLGSCEEAVEPLRAHHRAEMEALGEEAEASGARGVPGRKQLEERHHREERRWRTDELRAGLSVLAGAYRDRLADALSDSDATGPHGREMSKAYVEGIAAIEDLVAELVRNPNETLMLEALLVRLSAVATGSGT
jgi:DNA polymerase III subunit delta'